MKKQMSLFIPLYVVIFFLTTAFLSLPHEEINANAAEQIAAGGYHSLALEDDGTVWAWGYNYYGQLGDGTNTEYSNIPVQVSGLSGVIAIAGGGHHSLAAKSDGTVWAWGTNYFGELGDGTNTNSNIPVQVSGLSGVIAIAGGEMHSLAVKSDGTVWAWGQKGNWEGWNDGSSNIPAQVSGLNDVIAIAGGNYHSLAVKSDGTVWAWGANYFGVFGDGTNTEYSNIPVQVSGLSGVIAIAGGNYHSLAVKSDGTVWAWGANWYGQLGEGTNTHSNIPVQVSGLSGVIAIAGGGWHSLAVKSDGTVWAWGYNDAGQLGDGTNTEYSNIPVQVSGFSGVIAIAGGYSHSLAVKSDCTVWAWGYNPVQVSGLGLCVVQDTTAPIVSNTMANPNPVAVNTACTITAQIDDTASNISYAEYSTDGGIQWYNMDAITAGTNSVNVSVTTSGFTESKLLTVSVRGTDEEGNTSEPESIYLPVYDPSAGFVTGGGWIWSPKGAYTADTRLEGKANFGFVAKYKKGANIPDGNTEFQFKTADLNFHSNTYEWLVVAGYKAMFKGTGTINEEGSYKFMISAIDGSLKDSSTQDKFRIRIWEEDGIGGESTVYDNQMDADMDAEPTTTLGGGSIIIHKVK